MNSMKHGLSAAKHFVIDGEDPIAFTKLEDDLFAELQPRSRLEAEYVKRIVSLFWRLRRIPEFEAALVTWHSYRKKSEQDANPFSDNYRLAPEAGEEARRVAVGEIVNEVVRLGLTDKLVRHEAALHVQLSKSLQELKRLQLDRSAPIEQKLIEHEGSTPSSGDP